MLDSRAMTGKIRRDIAESIEKSAAPAIVVTHGTYTMAETARYLARALPAMEKTVILTGSLVPLRGFTESDAPYNLGYAVAAAQFLDPGIYIAMHSRIFLPEDVEKDVATARFQNRADPGAR